MSEQLIRRIEQYMCDNDMLAAGRHIIVGASGGADSMCLLFVLLKLRRKWQLRLSAVHINHGLRGIEADTDEAFVKDYCQANDVDFYVYRINIKAFAARHKLGEEEAGRVYRYQCFEEVLKAQNGDFAAVAHHLDDLEETVLLNIFRGTGLKGLVGIPSKREWIIRPLLCITRQEIETIVDNAKVSYRTDLTNFEQDYTRNRIRLNILPYVTEYINNQAKNHLYQLSNIAADTVDFIEAQADAAAAETLCGQNKLYIERFAKLHVVIQRELIRRLILAAAGTIKDVGFAHIEAVLNLTGRPVGKRVELPGGVIARRDYEMLEIVRETVRQEPSSFDEIDIEIPGEYYLPFIDKKITFTIIKSRENEIIPEKMYTKWFDYDKIKVGLKLRNRASGDYLIIDKKGSKKTAARIMIDDKVPRSERDQKLLLADGDHIIWLIGGRISEAYKVTSQTKNILVAKIKGE